MTRDITVNIYFFRQSREWLKRFVSFVFEIAICCHDTKYYDYIGGDWGDDDWDDGLDDNDDDDLDDNDDDDLDDNDDDDWDDDGDWDDDDWDDDDGE